VGIFSAFAVDFFPPQDDFAASVGGSSWSPHGLFVNPRVAFYELLMLTLNRDNFDALLPQASMASPICECSLRYNHAFG
jgi:hypothetical protein